MEKVLTLLTGEGGIFRVRALIAFAFVATVCYLFAAELTVPGELLALTGGVLGHYYATRAAA